MVRRLSHAGPTSEPERGPLVLGALEISSAPMSSGATRDWPSMSIDGATHDPTAAALIAGLAAPGRQMPLASFTNCGLTFSIPVPVLPTVVPNAMFPAHVQFGP